MELPRFDFTPHEWPPLARAEREGLADAVFEVEWDGERVEVLARWVVMERDVAALFFRRASEHRIHVVSSRSAGIAALASLKAIHGADQVTKLIVCRAIKGWNYSYGSAFRVPAGLWNTHNDQLVFVHHGNKFGCWGGCGSSGYPASFRVEEAQTTLNEAMENLDFPMRFALDWSQLSREERVRRAVCFRDANFNQVREVVKAIALAESSFYHRGEVGQIQWSEQLDMAWRDANRAGWYSTRPSPRLRRWNLHLQRAFAPRKDELLTARHLCVEQAFFGPFVCIQVTSPTRHERLEAALFLRDWARGKIPPDELRLLLPKL